VLTCAKIAGKEETPKCRKKTVTWTNEMIEELIDFFKKLEWRLGCKTCIVYTGLNALHVWFCPPV
jgi:L-fucose isomerase-like protein